MAWLVTHMWMALTAAAVFALLFGWTLRGILVTGKLRKAVVDKDIALTELDQARDEIERLFAAQRAQKGEGGVVADVSARKISDLTAELQKAKTELATLKTEAARVPPAAAPAPADDGHTPTIVLPPSRAGSDSAVAEPSAVAAPAPAPAGGETEESPTLVWRNRHLESRVKRLEEQLAKAISALASTTPAAPPKAVETVPTVDEEGVAKLKWQADYLKQRVEALEAELANAPAEAAAPAEDISEEMARLRWRNRFLEGRLAYFEGGRDEAAAEPVAEMTGAEAMLEQLEVADTAADMTEAVEALAEEVSAAGFAAEAAAEEAIEPEVDEAFEDVPDDEEESLAEADHADEDVLSDEEYSEEDFTADDVEDDLADEADAEEFDDEEEVVDEAEEDADEDDDESDEFEDEADEFEDEADEDGFDDEEDDPDEGEEDFDGDGEAYDEADDEDEDEYFEESDDDDDSYEDEDESDDDEAYDEVDEADDETEELDDDAEDEIDEDEADDEVEYESGEEIVAERPMAMDGPVEGHPDDLTMIGGIGPKIQVLLNELGIWHYDQIAAWSPENVAWVDEHLNFNGRIAREGWVGQAAVLVADEENV